MESVSRCFFYIFSMLSFNNDTKVILPSSERGFHCNEMAVPSALLIISFATSSNKQKKSSLKSRAQSFPGDKHERASCMFVFA